MFGVPFLVFCRVTTTWRQCALCLHVSSALKLQTKPNALYRPYASTQLSGFVHLVYCRPVSERMFGLRSVPCESGFFMFCFAITFSPSFSKAKFSVELVGFSEKQILRKEPYVSLQFTYTIGNGIAFIQYKHFRSMQNVIKLCLSTIIVLSQLEN